MDTNELKLDYKQETAEEDKNSVVKQPPADSDAKHNLSEFIKNDQMNLDSMSESELLELKKFLFAERIRVIQEKEEQKASYEKFLKERLTFQEEMKALNRKVLMERKRLKDESVFFEKKMQILQNGFLQLDMDRKKFEREKRQYDDRNKYSHSSYSSSSGYYRSSAPDFFKGVNNTLGLKKRYRDLLKIFHPDNLCGDSDTVLEINRQYDSMRKRMGEK